MTKQQLLDRAVEMAQQDHNTGLCLNCGAEHDGLEPDARARHCDHCHTNKVYAAEEIVIRLAF